MVGASPPFRFVALGCFLCLALYCLFIVALRCRVAVLPCCRVAMRFDSVRFVVRCPPCAVLCCAAATTRVGMGNGNVAGRENGSHTRENASDIQHECGDAREMTGRTTRPMANYFLEGHSQSTNGCRLASCCPRRCRSFYSNVAESRTLIFGGNRM